MMLQRILLAALFGAAAVSGGCTTGERPGGDDAGGDTGASDTSTADTSPADTGTRDTGVIADSATTDGGTADSSGGDTSPPGDAAMDATSDGASDAMADGGRPVGAACTASAQCLSGICIVGICRAPSCSDGIFNGDESDLDCGGSCGGCPPGGDCGMAADCASGICTSGTCATPSCTDGVQNQDETDVDCGGSTCTVRCAVSEMCAVGGDCTSGSCMGGACQAPTCTDGVMNGTETDIDCGGPTADGCPRCEDFRMCMRARDCTAGICRMGYCGDNPCIPFGSDSFGYTGCSYTPSALPCPDISSSGTATGLSDDGNTRVPIGFSFDFYGTSYTDVYIDANGGLTFDASRIGISNACPLPRSSSPRQLIAVFWDDLDPGEVGSEIWYETRGSAPNRQLIVRWDTERFGAGTNRGVFTVVLSEGSSDIQACYQDTSFGSATYDAGGSATAGIQSGTASVQYSCNMADLTDGLLVRYIHP